MDNAGEGRILRGGYIALSMNQLRWRDPPDITPQSFGASDREKL